MFLSAVMGYCCLHPGSTAKSVIFVYAARGETLILNVHFDACIRGFVHHIFGEENVTYRLTKFDARLDPQCTTPSNTCTSVYLGQNCSKIRSSWPNSVLAKSDTDCPGKHFP